MSAEPTAKLAESIVGIYVSDGNTGMGATSLRNHMSDPPNVMIPPEEVSDSVLTAGSRTHLEGALYGVRLAMETLTDAETEGRDGSALIEHHEAQIDSSVTRGLLEFRQQLTNCLQGGEQ